MTYHHLDPMKCHLFVACVGYHPSLEAPTNAPQGTLRVSNGGHTADGLAGCGTTCRLLFDAQGTFLGRRGWRWGASCFETRNA